MKAIFRVIVLLCLLLFLTSCGKAPDTGPDQVVGLLSKCRDMLSFCIYLLNQESPVYYNNVLERFYYAMLTLARIISGPSRLYSEEKTGNHEKSWKTCPPNVESLYGKKLKKLRIGVDYECDSWTFNQDCCRSKLKAILSDKVAYNSLKAKVTDVYENASARPGFVEQCDNIMSEIDDAMEEIRRKV